MKVQVSTMPITLVNRGNDIINYYVIHICKHNLCHYIYKSAHIHISACIIF